MACKKWKKAENHNSFVCLGERWYFEDFRNNAYVISHCPFCGNKLDDNGCTNSQNGMEKVREDHAKFCERLMWGENNE